MKLKYLNKIETDRAIIEQPSKFRKNSILKKNQKIKKINFWNPN